MLTLRQMRYFDALATTRHFGKAAELTHVSQPALSAQIMEMEAHLGVKLVERSRSGVFLTGKGEEVLEQVRSILADVGRLEESTRINSGTLEGRVRLGVIPTLAPYLVPRLIPYLRERYRTIEIELRESVTDRLLVNLGDGRLDAVVAALPVEADGIATRSLFSDRFYMAVAENDRTVLLSPITEKQMDISQLLLLEEGHCLRDQALAVCSSAGRRQLLSFGATSMATLLQMVANGMGMTLIPEIAIPSEAARNAIRIVPFAAPEPSREIGLIWRASNPRPRDMDALADAISTCAREVSKGAIPADRGAVKSAPKPAV
ncbi:LysR family transcriptional regulator [Sinorhizobium medicae]|uniref:hydrogen peroxide-inducible genes activator OxyR n=1 Tax=Sinorhizobium medicae TaxID=110321 RepID=UPI000400D7B5|nr:hydrogen peroxide-inducible genes activator OxyR [Sinorhizobium medicae]MDX0630315.1 LysR family transcriptional regulator [Sinorhizobium medicae]MDX0882975.1 LysR family transcriptional regulator [Sinorhizobium medicae]MQY00147.1 LysR family transcriptional regulator [Sinorhizobium medicae]RVH91065.1 hydrogen peroxide-inducible genes activator [Sinorhizobium medicae]RVJ51129.1 hydrogen peroxide-inducible genes activator [Sinorhizobium medicae]